MSATIRLAVSILAGVAFGVAIALILQSRLTDADAATTLAPAPASYAQAVSRAAPSVVNIYSARRVEVARSPLCRHPSFQDLCERYMPARARNQLSLGSGVIVRGDGYILTNEHIIRDAVEISVALRDGRQGTATLVGTDRETDLAVLHVELEALEAIPVADSTGARIGDVVLAIGNPFNIGQTVSQGIISATGRHGLGSGPFEDFLQTDAAINPGNSGGALVTAHGELIGINTLIYSRNGASAGIGLAIPSNDAVRIMESIVRNGRVIRGWLGIEVEELSSALAESLGVDPEDGLLIVWVDPDGPAAAAGLLPGDLLTSIQGLPAMDSRAVGQIVAATRPGERIALGVHRMGSRMTLEAVSGARPTT